MSVMDERDKAEREIKERLEQNKSPESERRDKLSHQGKEEETASVYAVQSENGLNERTL